MRTKLIRIKLVKTKLVQTKLKHLLLVGLANITSGIFFGAGCLIIERADSTWFHPETTVEANTVAPKDKTTAALNVEADDDDES